MAPADPAALDAAAGVDDRLDRCLRRGRGRHARGRLRRRQDRAGADPAALAAAEAAAVEPLAVAAEEAAAAGAATGISAMPEAVSAVAASVAADLARAAATAATLAAAGAAGVAAEAVAEPGELVERAHQVAAELADETILGVVAVGDRGRVIRAAGIEVDRLDFRRDRVVEWVIGPGPSAGHEARRQGDRERHPSPCSETHDQSLYVVRWESLLECRNTASGGRARPSSAGARHQSGLGRHAEVGAALPRPRRFSTPPGFRLWTSDAQPPTLEMIRTERSPGARNDRPIPQGKAGRSCVGGRSDRTSTQRGPRP